VVRASDLGRRISVSKQAAAKTIALLVERGYVAIETDARDARRKKLRVTALGFAAIREGEAVFEDLRERWVRQIGVSRVESLEATLATLVTRLPVEPGVG